MKAPTGVERRHTVSRWRSAIGTEPYGFHAWWSRAQRGIKIYIKIFRGEKKRRCSKRVFLIFSPIRSMTGRESEQLYFLKAVRCGAFGATTQSLITFIRSLCIILQNAGGVGAALTFALYRRFPFLMKAKR